MWYNRRGYESSQTFFTPLPPIRNDFLIGIFVRNDFYIGNDFKKIKMKSK